LLQTIKKKIKNIIYLSHHDDSNPYFEFHVYIIRNYAICIGCLAELSALIFSLFNLLLFPFVINFLLENQMIWTILIIASTSFNYLIYIYRFIKKTEFKYKHIRFLARFIIFLGLFLDIFGIILKNYFIIGTILIISLGSIFIFLRYFSSRHLQKYELKISKLNLA